MLKILEEPPDKTLFLLISEDHDQVLPTIASRCLPVRIPLITAAGQDDSEENQFNHNTFRQWMLDCHQRKMVKLVEFAADVSKIGRERQKSLLRYGLDTARNCMSYKYTGILPPATEEEKAFITKLSKLLNQDNLPVFSGHLNQSIYHIERNAHAPTLFLDLSMKMVQFFTGPSGKS
jgi:DNA polymerase-3 subunit delta'